MAKQLSATDKTAIVTHLLALGFDAPARLDLLWTDRLRALRPHIARHARPADQLAGEVDALSTLTDGHALLMELLDNALRISSDALPAKALLAALITRLDDRGGALGLTRRMGALELKSTELTVCLDRFGDHIRLGYRIGGQPVGPTANYPAAHAADPAINPFELLFPAIRGAGRPDPLAAAGARPTLATALRLRVATRDPQLEAIDWWAATAEGTRLVAPKAPTPWTLEVTPDAHPTAQPRLARIPRVIVLSPDPLNAADLRAVLHMHSTDHRLDNRVIAAPDMHRLRSISGTRKAPLLLVAGLDADALDALVTTLALCDADHRPAAVVLVKPPPDFRPTRLLAGTAAVACAPDIEAAHIWLLAVLVDGCDPVTAAHCDRLPAPPLAIFTTFAGWPPAESSREDLPLPALVLDRIHQRRAVAGQLETLIKRDGSHHVEVFVAVGPPENKLDELAEQIDEHITDKMGELDFDRRAIHFPRPPPAAHTRPISADQLKSWLWGALAAGLHQAESMAQPALLKTLAEQRIRGTDRVVWLDWGTFGSDGAPPLLTPSQLSIWLDWHQDLAAQIPEKSNLRIASFLACEDPQPERRDRIIARVRLMSLEGDLNTVRYTPLPPVGDVPPEELRAYLNDYQQSRIPPELVRDLARALDAKTSGRFVELVALIERAWVIGPRALLSKLTVRAPATDDDTW